jgi:hypothetical protein
MSKNIYLHNTIEQSQSQWEEMEKILEKHEQNDELQGRIIRDRIKV